MRMYSFSFFYEIGHKQPRKILIADFFSCFKKGLSCLPQYTLRRPNRFAYVWNFNNNPLIILDLSKRVRSFAFYTKGIRRRKWNS
jgi:hypothetical protein